MKKLFKLYLRIYNLLNRDFNKKYAKEGHIKWFLSLPLKLVFWYYIILNILLLIAVFFGSIVYLFEFVGFLFSEKSLNCNHQIFREITPFVLFFAWWIYAAFCLRKKSLILSVVFLLSIGWSGEIYRLLQSVLF